MMLLRAWLIVTAVIAAGSGGVGRRAWLGHYNGPIRANCVVDGDSF